MKILGSTTADKYLIEASKQELNIIVGAERHNSQSYPIGAVIDINKMYDQYHILLNLAKSRLPDVIRRLIESAISLSGAGETILELEPKPEVKNNETVDKDGRSICVDQPKEPGLHILPDINITPFRQSWLIFALVNVGGLSHQMALDTIKVIKEYKKEVILNPIAMKEFDKVIQTLDRYAILYELVK